jgi:hypothetical protein
MGEEISGRTMNGAEDVDLECVFQMMCQRCSRVSIEWMMNASFGGPVDNGRIKADQRSCAGAEGVYVGIPTCNVRFSLVYSAHGQLSPVEPFKTDSIGVAIMYFVWWPTSWGDGAMILKSAPSLGNCVAHWRNAN